MTTLTLFWTWFLRGWSAVKLLPFWDSTSRTTVIDLTQGVVIAAARPTAASRFLPEGKVRVPDGDRRARRCLRASSRRC